MTIVKAEKIKKSYNDFVAVNSISFEIKRGEIFGFLGPNGAGKTTTIRMITCFFSPDEGSLFVFGKDVRKNARFIKSKIGLVPQENNLDPDFSVQKNLTIYAGYFGLKKKKIRKRVQGLLREFELEEKKDDIIEHLSGGLKRRLTIARAFVNEPDLVIFDEPTTGLDPQLRHYIWEKIKLVKEKGKTIILTTHYMEEAQYLCDRVAIMHKGKIIEEGNPYELIKKHIGRKTFEIWIKDENIHKIKEILKGRTYEIFPNRIFVYLKEDEEFKIDFECDYLLREANLEDVFLKLTGRKLNGY